MLETSGNPAGYIAARGNGHQPSSGDLAGFSAVFRGNFVVAQAGTQTINVASQDGFIFGISNGAVRISGVNVNAPASTPFAQYPVMGANNGPSTGTPTPIAVSFPQPGSYPYEIDYRSGTGGLLTFTNGLRALYSLVLTSGTTAATTGQLAGYTFRATDETGAPIPQLAITVNVAGLAPKTLSATTDTNGLATVSYIQTSAMTDSLTRSASADFGKGWSLGVNVQLSVSTNYDVTLTLNGQRRTFYFTPYLVGYQDPVLGFMPNLLGVYYSAYTAEPGTHGTLTVGTGGSGMIGSNTGCLFDWIVRSPDGIYFCCSNAGNYGPGSYVYTDPYGRVYTISATGGLQSIKDLGGNTLTVTPNGISSTNGLNVPFVRDPQGRITKITDPLGKDYLYSYDAAGNLSDVTYPDVPRPAHYNYDPSHLYTGGTDPRNNPLPATEYYGDGRLKSVTQTADPNTSYRTSYSYDVASRTTTVTYPDTHWATLVYDVYGMLLSSTDPMGHTTTNVYDAKHNLTSVTDSLNHTTTYTYDANGNRTSVTNALNKTSRTAYNQYSEPAQTTDELGNIRTFTYDANFWPKLAADALGPVVSFTFNANGTMQSKAVGYDLATMPGKATAYTYDPYGNLATETDALTRQTTYTYDTLGRKKTMTPPGGAQTTYDYDALGHLTTLTEPLARITRYEYDENGNKHRETNPNNAVTIYDYDGLNRLKQVTYPTTPSTTTLYTYDFRNNVIDTTDQAGHVTHNEYDAAGRLTATTTAYLTPDAQRTTYTYYDDGRKHTETDAANHTTTYNYDAAGRLTSVVDAQNHTTAYAYDDAGNQTSVTDANNHTTQSQYDARKRLQKTIYADNTTTQYEYDGPGNLTKATDQAGNVVRYVYDAANQLQSVVQQNHPDPLHNTTSYAYDPRGNLMGITDANSHTTQNAFDMLNQLTTETLPSGTLTQTRNYDGAGNLTSLTDYNGKTTTYTYDSLNRLTAKIPDLTLNETTERFTYTATGKRESMTDASGTTTYTYDAQDRLKTKATPQGTLSYTYDAAGNVASITSSNLHGVSVNYTYDALNRLSTVVDNNLPVNLNTTRYTYDPANNLATAMYPNGISSTFVYDDLNRLKSVNGYSYTLGATGNRQSATEPNGRTLNWSYDGIYRLTNETITLDPRSKNGTVDYGLDPVGNRLSQASSIPGISTGSFTYDANDRLSTETYDNNGNTLTSGGKTFAYDFENRLESMNGGAVTIQYDGDGNRVAKTVGGATTRYLVDDLNPTGYVQVVEELGGATVTRRYSLGLQRVSQDHLINSTWTSSFYGYDGGGSVRTLSDVNGTVTDAYDYDALGNAVSTTGSTPNVYLYRGEQYDTDLGLYYLRARYLNPLTGRFLTRDPYAGEPQEPVTLHKYQYAADDPVNRTDPLGLLVGEYERGLQLSQVFAYTVAVGGGAAIGTSISCIWMTGGSWLGVADLVASGTLVSEIRRTKCGIVPRAQKSPTPAPTPDPDPDPQDPPDRKIPKPDDPRRGCTCTCRADADGNMPGNIKAGEPRFTFGTATAGNCPEAAKGAKRIAIHALGMKPKHVGCRCSGK